MESQKKTMILCLRNEMFRDKKRPNPLVIGGRIFNYADIGLSNPMYKMSSLDPTSFFNNKKKYSFSITDFLKKKIDDSNPLLCNQLALKKEEDPPGTLFIFFLGFGLGILFRSSFLFQRFR